MDDVNPAPDSPQENAAAPDAELARRETELTLRERRLKAGEELLRRGLPPALAEGIDLTSDETMQAGLHLASLAAVAPLGPPRDSVPLGPIPMTYRERAALYQQDPQAYRSILSR